MGRAHSRTIHDTAELAGKLGVKTIVTMSGLPEAAPGDNSASSGNGRSSTVFHRIRIFLPPAGNRSFPG